MSDERCEEYCELASASADGQLAGADLLRLERHHGECPGCRQFAADLRRTHELLQAAEVFRPLSRPAPGFSAAVMRRLVAEQGPRIVVLPPRRAPRVWVGMALAAATAALFFAWSWFRLLPAEQPAQTAARPAPRIVAEEGSMENYLRHHAAIARDATLLGSAEEVDFATYHGGSIPRR